MKKIVITLSLLFYTISLTAQLFRVTNLYPPDSHIKSKSFNVSGGHGFSSTRITDSLGRVVEEKYFRKKVLLSTQLYQYNDKGDLLCIINDYDISHPNRKDTTRYIYTYQQQHIQSERVTYANHRTEILQLTANDGEARTYRYMPYADDQEKELLPAAVYDCTLTYQNGLIVKRVQKASDNSVTTTFNDYYSNGLLKHVKIERDPKPEGKTVYVGGPGSDDQEFRYVYDKRGYVKRLYTIVNGKTYKIASYRYSSIK